MVRTPRVRYLSAQRMTLAKSPESVGSTVAREPSMTSPVEPSRLIMSWRPKVRPLTVKVPLLASMATSPAPGARTISGTSALLSCR